MSEATKTTVIQDGTEVEGKIRSKSAVVVHGSVNGALHAPELTVTASGSVRGHVRVEQLVAEGELSGEIDAETVELSGSVGDRTVIHAETLEVRMRQPDGVQVTFGNCELRVGAGRAGTESREWEEELASDAERDRAPID
jgi:cytoskeletal protein CcmA (bactofilin family)